MTCKEFIAFLLDYLEGTVTAQERRAFEAHLAECPDCVAYVEMYRLTVELEKWAFRPHDAPIPAAVHDDLIKAVLAARPVPPT